MTTRHPLLMLATVFALAGCRDRATESAKPVTPEARTESAPHPKQPGNLVTVSNEMLRDLRITTSTVEKRRGGEGTNVLGELSVNANAYAEVGTSVQGRVVALRAAEGERVQQGQLLATIESGDLARVRADVATAEARARLANQTLERKQALVAERIAPARELQEAENDAAAAAAQVRAARAALEALGVTDAQPPDASTTSMPLRSPIAGTVLERAGAIGQVVDPLKPLFRIADLSTVWLNVQAFERDAVRLRLNSPARISFAAMPGRPFDGTIAFIGSTVNPESRTVSVRVVLQNRDGSLRPGMSASALLPVGDQTTDLLTVPAAALQRVRDGWCVFVPRSDSVFEIRPVGRGRDLGGEVEIVSGVKAGESIVVDGAFLLKAETERAASEGDHEAHP